MIQLLIIVGAFIFLVLGSIHLLYTIFTNKLAPRNATTMSGMKKSKLILTSETTVWKAWVGFNASHSLGAMFFALIYMPLCIFHFEVIEDTHWFTWLPVAFSFSYLLLAKAYWFRVPFIGILIANICFSVSALMLTFGSTLL